MSKFLFASGNEGKIHEVRDIMKASDIEVLSPQDLVESADFPACNEIPQVDETENSYRGNALLKAKAYSEWSGLAAVADDSGLEVEALDGQPGLFTARYAGEGASSKQNRSKMLSELDDVSNRSARFVCVLCYFQPDGQYEFVEGELLGHIATEERGGSGFGYDPIFEVEGTGRTLAEMKDRQEVETHRSRAFASLIGTCSFT